MTGSWQFWDENSAPESRAHITNYRKGPCDTIFFQDSPGAVAGALMADALNVHEATGLTPSQLQARVAELEAALHRTEVAINTLEYCYISRPENFALALTAAKSDALSARDVLDAKP